jgi:hypothetical protein
MRGAFIFRFFNGLSGAGRQWSDATRMKKSRPVALDGNNFSMQIYIAQPLR